MILHNGGVNYSKPWPQVPAWNKAMVYEAVCNISSAYPMLYPCCCRPVKVPLIWCILRVTGQQGRSQLDITGGRGGITQGVSFEFFEFFECFLLIYLHNTHWVNFEFFQKLLTTLIKTYSQGNCRNWSKKALHLAQWVILSKNPKVLSWIYSKFAHSVPHHLLNGFFESLLKNWTKLRVFFG